MIPESYSARIPLLLDSIDAYAAGIEINADMRHTTREDEAIAAAMAGLTVLCHELRAAGHSLGDFFELASSFATLIIIAKRETEQQAEFGGKVTAMLADLEGR